MDLCQVSYALGSVSAARSSLASAQRALERDDNAGDSESNGRALVAVGKALSLLETAMHELGAEIAAHQLLSGPQPCSPAEVAIDKSREPGDVAHAETTRPVGRSALRSVGPETSRAPPPKRLRRAVP
jgi:hypothetical protein